MAAAGVLSINFNFPQLDPGDYSLVSAVALLVV